MFRLDRILIDRMRLESLDVEEVLDPKWRRVKSILRALKAHAWNGHASMTQDMLRGDMVIAAVELTHALKIQIDGVDLLQALFSCCDDEP